MFLKIEAEGTFPQSSYEVRIFLTPKAKTSKKHITEKGFGCKIFNKLRNVSNRKQSSIKMNANDLNRHLSKADTQMAHKAASSYSIPYVLRKLQIKTMRCYCALGRVAKIQTTTANVFVDVRCKNLFLCLRECKIIFTKAWQFPTNIKIV